MRYPASTYRQQSVQGATPLEMVVMLYDGAVTALQCAIAAMEAKDIEKKCKHLGRLDGIIAQLEGTLDFEHGGQVAETLKLFYTHARSQSMKANIENSKETLNSLVQQFSTVREAWEQIARPSPSTATAPPIPRPHLDPYQESEPPSLRLTA